MQIIYGVVSHFKIISIFFFSLSIFICNEVIDSLSSNTLSQNCPVKIEFYARMSTLSVLSLRRNAANQYPPV